MNAEDASLPSIDRERVHRLTRHFSELLVGVLKIMDEFATKSKPLRTKIIADLNSLLEGLSPAHRGCLWSMVTVELEASFQSPKVLALLGENLASKAVSKQTVKVDGSADCLGAPGAGVTVEIDGAIAGACVTGSFGSGPTGGGVSGGFRY